MLAWAFVRLRSECPVSTLDRLEALGLRDVSLTTAWAHASLAKFCWIAVIFQTRLHELPWYSGSCAVGYPLAG